MSIATPVCDAVTGKCEMPLADTNAASPAASRTVVIVGGGLAGMTAAIEAQRQGAYVVLLDKEKSLGGNSAKASSGMNAVATPPQIKLNISDSLDRFVADTLASGQGLSDSQLVRILADYSLDAWNWLEKFDIPLSVLSRTGGHSAARTHRNAPDARGRIANVGWTITSRLSDYLKALPTGRIEILTETKLESLVTNSAGDVIGAVYRRLNETSSTTRYADAVVLATGGYSRAPDLLSEFAPSVSRFPSTNGPFATGDGVQVARRIGASLNLMDKVQLHPTGLVDPKDPAAATKFLGPEALRGTGGILINKHGKRFCDELGLRDAVTNAILEHGDSVDNGAYPTAFLIMNDAAVQDFQPQIFNFYASKGFVRKFANAEELAVQLNLPLDTLKTTLISYADAASGKSADEFGKAFFPVVFRLDEPLHVLQVTPSIHYTMGGLRVSPTGQVLRESDNFTPIKGLFAAGEVTGGLHGQNRLAGNSLLECIVFGKIVANTIVSQFKDPIQYYHPAAFAKLRETLGDRFSETPASRLTHSRDHSYHPARLPDAVAWPLTAEDVAAVVKICNEYKVPLIPYGVGSSLEGHTSALNGGITLNMTLMDKMVEYHDGEMAVTVQAGIRRNALNAILKPKGVFFPVDPGADATLGGMTATGASGTLAVGYGTMRENIVRLKIVTATGDIMTTASRARKSSAGYDLTHLFIGSEGTLGVIVEITLRLYEIPTSAAAVCSFPSSDAATKTIMKAKAIGLHAQRIELLNGPAIAAVNKKFNTTYTITPKLFLEFHGADETEVKNHAEAFQRVAHEFGGDEYAIAYAQEERDKLWQARHGAYWAASSLCANCKLFVTDVCVPIARLAESVTATEEDFSKSKFGAPPIVGHAGDGNYHVMLPLDVNNPQDVQLAHELAVRMVNRAIDVDGTCTGEHGVGLGKVEFMRRERGDVALQMMRAIKATLDPNNIMNPGKIIPAAEDAE